MLTFPTLITGTATGMRISAVDGTAFLDNCPADVLAAVGIGAQIKIYDSSSRYLQGVIDVAGSSETLGDNISHFASLDLTKSPWAYLITATVNDSNTFTNTATNGVVGANILQKTALYKSSLNGSATAGVVSLQDAAGGIFVTSGETGKYRTEIAAYANIYFNNNGGGIGAVTDINSASVQQVTAPSSSGIIIKDLSGNQNFISKGASFTYNAASYRYAFYDTLKVSRPTRYMGVSTHNI